MTSEKQTLVNLTQGFLKILMEAGGNDVELSYCEEHLKTTKRRLYDVINVLSGVNLVERTGKSKVHWTGNSTDGNNVNGEKPISEREKELDRLIEKVDSEIVDLSESELFKKCAWITLDELKKFEPDDDTALFSLCGPPTLKVTMDKDESGANRLFCKIENGEGEINLNQLTHKERYPQQVQMNLI